MKTTAPVASTCAAKMWAKATMSQTRRQHPMLSIFILHQSNGHHNCHSSQHNRKQTSNTYQKNTQNITQLMDYAAKNPNAIITYRASSILLVTHSNVSYLSEPKAWSWSGGHFFILTKTIFILNNGAVYITAQILKHNMPLVVEADIVTFFVNRKLATQLWHTLAKMGHPSSLTAVQINNFKTFGAVTKNQLWVMKAIDMHFY